MKNSIVGDRQRLETLLTTFEKNLRLEVFFIRRRETDHLLELLPNQQAIAEAIVGLVDSLRFSPGEEDALRKRLAVADALREANRSELQRVMDETKRELGEMNAASRRIRQMRKITKANNFAPASGRLQDWA